MKNFASNANTSVYVKSKKCRIRLMRSAIIKKVRQGEQKNQTTTTNNNYIQIFMSILKKLNKKVKIMSNKTETEINNLYFTRKDIEPVHNKARLQLDKNEKKEQQK